MLFGWQKFTDNWATLQCDGKQPCSRCASREGLVCMYDPHLKTVKKDLKAEIDRLRAERRMMDRIFEALVEGSDTDLVIDQLRSGQSLEAISTQFPGKSSWEAGSTSSTAPASHTIGSRDDANLASAQDGVSNPTGTEQPSVSNSARDTPIRA